MAAAAAKAKKYQSMASWTSDLAFNFFEAPLIGSDAMQHFCHYIELHSFIRYRQWFSQRFIHSNLLLSLCSLCVQVRLQCRNYLHRHWTNGKTTGMHIAHTHRIRFLSITHIWIPVIISYFVHITPTQPHTNTIIGWILNNWTILSVNVRNWWAIFHAISAPMKI